MLNGAYHYIDLSPRGRHETATQSWVRRHDEYEDPMFTEPASHVRQP
jgi:predicted dithiol-disulfide oxidoreductase (DUF899 family)